MASIKNISSHLNQLTDVPSSDPDDARRRKLLNILLTGIAILSILTIFVVILSYAFNIIKNTNDVWLGLGAAIGLLIGVAIFWFLNRNQNISGWVASSLFLLFLMVVFSFSDSKVELANGRSLFIFTIPIIMA
ncbi:MAG: hypothetical protein WBL25_03375, partial [Anaerolineales bacterium]